MFTHKSTVFLFFLFAYSCDEPSKNAPDPNAYSTANVLCDLNREVYNNDESVKATSRYAWTCDADIRNLAGNGIPDHEVGTFPNANNPNTIRAQHVNEAFTIHPLVSSDEGVPVGGPRGVIAYALNSVKFDPGTAGRCDDNGNCSLAQGQGRWNIEALGHDTFDFGDDMNHAHVQPSGAYHYHGIPELFVAQLDKGVAMTLIGWAADGFPVYARYGYTDPDDPKSDIKIMKSSWQLKSTGGAGRPDTLRSLRGGPSGNTNLSKPIPLGAFTQDFEYVEGSGDLDRCNGRIGVTPEFPGGIYYYMVTDAFPFFSRCLKGKL